MSTPDAARVAEAAPAPTNGSAPTNGHAPTNGPAPAAPAPAATTNGHADPHPSNGANGQAHPPNGQPGQPVGQNGQPHAQHGQPNQPGGNGCTAPQLRRFIKSRPYVPMHELRRRFGIDGDDDDVTQVRLDAQAVYVGLPDREGHLLGELLRGGEIGYELSLDPRTPVVIGVYPMRPVPRT